MSLELSLSNAVSGLKANQRSVAVTSHNIANAHTEGYTRQTAERASRHTAGTGGGVEIAEIRRTVDAYLQREVRVESATLARHQVAERFLGRVMDMFGTLAGDDPLAGSIARLSTAIESLSVEPESATRRLALVEAAAALARDLNGMSGHVQGLREEIDREIAAAVHTVNDRLEQIAGLNAKIVHGENTGQPTADLRDARDRAIDDVARLMDIRYFERPSGEIAIYTGNGTMLVDGAAQPVTFDPAGVVGIDTAFNQIEVAGKPVGHLMTDGRIKGLLDLRDGTLVELQAQLDALAEQLRDRVNLAHNRGTALPPPNALTGTRAFADVDAASIALADPVRIAVLDANGVIRAHYDLEAGSYTVAEIRDAIGAGLAGDAVVGAADGSGLGIRAADPAFGIAIVDLAGGADAALAFDDGSGAPPRTFTGFSTFFGLNDLFVTPGAVAGDGSTGLSGRIAVRPDILADPARLARGRLTDEAAPIPGATVGVAAGDPSNLLGLAAELDREAEFGRVGSLPATRTSIGAYAGQILGLTAQKAASASEQASYQERLATGLATRLGSASGVNVDEEMANLIVFQNAYAASARAISAIDEMYKTLTRMV